MHHAVWFPAGGLVLHWGNCRHACLLALLLSCRPCCLSVLLCALYRRTACFESVAISQLKFSDFDLKDNVGLLTLLRYKQQQQAEPQRSRQEQRRLDRQLQRQQVRRMQERERQWQQLRQQQRKGQEQDFSSSSSSSSSDDSDSDSDLPHARRAAGQAAAAGPFIAVANTHTLFNPKRGDIKLGQLRLLIKHLQALLSASLPPEQVPAVAALVIGDMNHQPHTPIYNFMRQGWLDCLQQHRKAMAGGAGAGQAGPWRPGAAAAAATAVLPSCNSRWGKLMHGWGAYSLLQSLFGANSSLGGVRW